MPPAELLDLLHCPYRDGWEVGDQPLGVLGTNPGSIAHAQLVRQWSDGAIFLAHAQERRRSLRARRRPGRGQGRCLRPTSDIAIAERTAS